MKNVLKNLKLEQKKFGNITIENMEIFYDMCIDATNCIDSIRLPEILKGLMSFGTLFLRSVCDDYGFQVGPFSKCIQQTHTELNVLRNSVYSRDQRECELTASELSELETIIKTKCDEKSLEDMRKNEKKVTKILCSD